MFLGKVIKIFYGNVCGVCEKSIKSNSYTCLNCSSILKYYKERYHLKNNFKYVDELFSLYEYRGIIKKKILQFKFKNKKYLGKFFAYMISKRLKELKIEFDVIVPVPISFSRYLERGYNQSHLLAKNIAMFFNKKMLKNALVKVKNNKRQSNLHLNDRKNNVIGVYKIKNGNLIKEKIVLLVDDIYTTGATIDECSKILKQAGVRKIIAVTIAYV